MATPVEEIKERLSIEEIVGGYVKLERAGKNLKAKCPFHNEKTASFFVSPDRGSFYCFGCGAKGDLFSFVEKMEGLDFKGALKLLAERAGVRLSHSRARAGEQDTRERLFAVLERAARFFESTLAQNAEAQKYLTGRSIVPQTIAAWRIGFALDEWRALRARLRADGFSDNELRRAGLIKQSAEKGGEHYDVFRGRIMFPIFDTAGRVAAFSGRILGAESENVPKYLNTPETEVFHKSKMLFGLHAAKQAIRERGYALLVEGQVDLILAHQAGFTNAIATSGTALTSEHLDALRKFSENILLAYDADTAGECASRRAISLALQKGMAVKIAILPGKDPAEVIAKNPKNFAKALMESRHAVEFLLEKALLRAKSTRERATLVRIEVLPFVRDIQSAIERAGWIQKIAAALGVREEAVWEDFGKQKPEVRGQKSDIRGQTSDFRSPMSDVRKQLAGIIWWQEKLAEKERWIDVEKLKKEAGALPDEEVEPLIFEAEAQYADAERLTKEVRLLLLAREKETLEAARAELQDRIARAGRTKTDASTLLPELHRISVRIEEIKRASAE